MEKYFHVCVRSNVACAETSGARIRHQFAEVTPDALYYSV